MSICSNIDSTILAAYPVANIIAKSKTFLSDTFAIPAAVRNLCTLAACMAIITSVAAFDVYWSFKTQDILHETEQNPLGTMLIQMDNGDIALFMTCKMLGTMIVLFAIPCLYSFRNWWGIASGISLASYQVIVFLYLNFGHIVC